MRDSLGESGKHPYNSSLTRSVIGANSDLEKDDLD